MFRKSVKPLSHSIVCWRLFKYDLNHWIAEELNLYQETLNVELNTKTISKDLIVESVYQRSPTRYFNVCKHIEW